MDENGVKRQVGRSLAWVGGATMAISVLDVLASILLTVFWLSASDLGIAAIALWLFPVITAFAEAGLSASIVQRDTASEEAVSSLFWLNIALSVLAGGVVLVSADLLAGEATAANMLRAFSIKVLLDNTYFVPAALMRRELRFRELSIIRVVANVVLVGGKVGFAAAGFGPWCFLFGLYGHMIVNAIGTQLVYPWRPRFLFRWRECAAMVRFGWKTALREILFHLYVNADYRVVYAFFGAAATGVYRFAYERILDPVRSVSLVVTDVAFPTFSRLATRHAAVVEQFLRFTRANLLAVAPAMALVALGAEDLVRLVWPDLQWRGSVTPMQILCLVGVLRSLSFVLPALFDGLGRPIVPLLYTLLAAVVLPGSYVLCAWLLGPRFGMVSVAIAWAIGYPVAFAVLLGLALRELRLPFGQYLRAIVGVPACIAGASVVAYGARVLAAPLPPGGRLAVVTVVFAAILLPLLARVEGITPRAVLQSVRG
jgi:PST family polysaccharide transporter